MSRTAADSITGDWGDHGHNRVPAWIYSDPDLFKQEMDRFFYGPTWNYVGLECEIPEPGSYKRSWVGTRPVIITRSNDGVISVLENRCAHRGAPVCWQNRGQAKTLTCPYHQWNYDLTGRLRGLPFKSGLAGQGGMPDGFKREDNGLRRLQVTVRGGSIWASFDPEVPAFEDYVGPELLAHVDRLFSGRPLRLLGYSRQIIPCNWKLYFENSRDPYHATLLHTFFVSFGLYRADSSETVTAPTMGGRHMINTSMNAGKTLNKEASEITRFRHGFTLNDKESVSPRQEFERMGTTGLQVFPSVFLQQHANSLAMRHIIPKSPSSVELSWTYYGYADDDDEMKRLRLKHANLTGPAGYVSMDDSEVLEVLHGVVSQYPRTSGVIEMGGYEVEPQSTMVTEVGLRAFYKFYREAMNI